MSLKEVVILYTPFVILLMLFIGSIIALIIGYKEEKIIKELTKDKDM